MHLIRLAVRENRLTTPGVVEPASYLPFVDSGSIWVAEMQGKVVGFAALDPAAGSVWALFVAPQCEGRGVGRALHDVMLRDARLGDLARLALATEQSSRAERFYRRAGWQEAGPRPDGQVRFTLDIDR